MYTFIILPQICKIYIRKLRNYIVIIVFVMELCFKNLFYFKNFWTLSQEDVLLLYLEK